MYQTEEIKQFISNKSELKHLFKLTKETDSFYLQKRDVPDEYNPKAPYDFDSWKHLLDNSIKRIYESLHKTLLYTNEKQDFDLAIQTFEDINRLLKEVDE